MNKLCLVHFTEPGCMIFLDFPLGTYVDRGAHGVGNLYSAKFEQVERHTFQSGKFKCYSVLFISSLFFFYKVFSPSSWKSEFQSLLQCFIDVPFLRIAGCNVRPRNPNTKQTKRNQQSCNFDFTFFSVGPELIALRISIDCYGQKYEKTDREVYRRNTSQRNEAIFRYVFQGRSRVT